MLVGKIIGLNFERRHHKDDSGQHWFKVVVRRIF